VRAAIARLAPALLAIGLCAATAACGGTRAESTVTISVPWDTISEYRAFYAVIAPFDAKHNIDPNVEVTRSAGELVADLKAGDQPDLVDLSSPGEVNYFKDNGLRPLTTQEAGIGDYAQPWRGLAMLGSTSKVYAVPVKADVQSLLWSTAAKPQPATMATLQALSGTGTPWCLGLRSGPASGWPGASWIADILLSRYGASEYQNWLSGKLAWSSPDVSQAWKEWGGLVRNGDAVRGGVRAALDNKFSKKQSASACELAYGARIATQLPSSDGYNYEAFPRDAGSVKSAPLLVSGDFMGRFTDNPAAKRLLEYLAKPTTQALWAHQSAGYAFSADTQARLAYTGRVQEGIQDLLRDNTRTRCFNAEDLMTPNVSTAFSRAVQLYFIGHTALPSLLTSMQSTQSAAGSSPIAPLACSTPGAS